MIKRIGTTEEFWPGQRENVRTARIEVWTGEPGQRHPLEVGRITAEADLFKELRDLVEGALGREER